LFWGKKKALPIGKASKLIVEDIGFEPMTPCVQGSACIVAYNYLSLHFVIKVLKYNYLMNNIFIHSNPLLIIKLTPALTPVKNQYDAKF